MVAIGSGRRVPVPVVSERIWASKMSTPVDSNIVVLPEPVERTRVPVARIPGLVPHTHPDTGHNNTVADSNTDAGSNSREEDKPGQLQCRWEFQSRCGFLLPLGLKNKKELQRTE